MAEYKKLRENGQKTPKLLLLLFVDKNFVKVAFFHCTLCSIHFHEFFRQIKSNANQVTVFNLTNFSSNQSKIKLHGMVVYYSIDLRIFHQIRCKSSFKLHYSISRNFHQIKCNSICSNKISEFFYQVKCKRSSGFNLTKFSVKSNEVSLWGAKLSHFRSS